MSNGHSDMPPPPGVVNVSSLSAVSNISKTTGKRRSRFSDAPPPNLQNSNVKIPPPPKVISIPFVKDAINAQPQTDNQSASERAAAAAARINANLMAQGKLKTAAKTGVSMLTSQSIAPTANISSASATTPPMNMPEIKRIDDMYIAEVVINDIPLGCRNYLTRLTTQENINKSCHAYVSTRGKFMLPDDKKLNQQQGNPEKPLYLFVQSQDEDNVRKALERIKQSINNHYQKKSQYLNALLQQTIPTDKKDPTQMGQQMSLYPHMPHMMSTMPPVQGFTNPYCSVSSVPTVPLPHFQPTLPSGNYVQEKLFIRIDNVPETYDLKGKLLGPCYRNFTFISNQTGAKVILRGRGSGFLEPTSGREAFEAMHAFISHPNQAGVEASKKLVLNLVETLRKEVTNLTNTAGVTPVGYSTVQNNYFANTLPVMPAINPMTTGPAVSTCPIVTTPQFASEVTNNSKRKFEEADHDDSNVLGYQHNFTGTASNSSYSGSSAEDGEKLKDKSRKKRFTEESPMPPPPMPPLGDKSFNKKLKPQAVSTEEDKTKTAEEMRDEEKQDPFKTPSLPFWMAP